MSWRLAASVVAILTPILRLVDMDADEGGAIDCVVILFLNQSRTRIVTLATSKLPPPVWGSPAPVIRQKVNLPSR